MVPLQPQRGTTAEPEIAHDVRLGLSRPAKSLPPRLFYDAAGSALFERITRLEEYYLTRTERAIFEAHGSEMMAAAGPGLTLIELGAGTAEKTRVLIGALLRRQLRATYIPIDVSRSALRIAEESLQREFPALHIRPMVGDYSQGLAKVAATPGSKLVLYIGSSIGNFEPEEAAALLRTIRHALSAGDALLLGTDLVKDEATLHAAYNDAAGVTAAFNKNVLARINRELGADFDLDSFAHVAIWNAQASRIEMHLESLADQAVTIPELGMRVRLLAGERIHTENSYKFTPERVERILQAGGFLRELTWTDPRGWFGVHLARVHG